MKAWGLIALVSMCLTSAFADDPALVKQLQDNLQKSRTRLGSLKGWQDEIFDAEVLSATSRFIRDYKNERGKVTQVQVDLEALKRFLAFHASEAQISSEQQKILVSASLDGECDSCTKVMPELRQLIKSRLERRGLTPIILSVKEAKLDPSTLLTEKKAGSYLKLNVIAEEDPDHPGEKTLRVKMENRFPGSTLGTVSREVELPPSDSLEVAVTRLWIESVSQLGADTLRVGHSEVSDEGGEWKVSNVGSLNDLIELKKGLQARFPGGRVVEKEIVGNEVTFEIAPKSAILDNVAKLSSVPVGDFMLKVSNKSEGFVESTVERRPASSAGVN